MQFPDARILIFAKAPQPGRVKTRLAPCLGKQGAADFHAKCVRYAVDRLCASRLAPVVLYAAPDASADLFVELAARYPVTLATQQGDDLGERMHRACREQLGEARALLLVGADAPALQPQHLRQALALLQEGRDLVMQPAEDGGYVMLGLASDQPALFSDMPWGTDQVASATRACCGELGLSLAELPLSWDLDRPQDLERLAELDDFNAFSG